MPHSRDYWTSVFVNIPYDKKYEKVFVGIVAGLLSLGKTPHFTFEIAEKGKGRLNRIMDLIDSCFCSFHDLSRVGCPVRFNMPFELGIAFALSKFEDHEYYILEAKERRKDKTLSDLNGIDEKIHKFSIGTTIHCILDCLAQRNNAPDSNKVKRFGRDLWKICKILKKEHKRDTIFYRYTFFKFLEFVIALASSQKYQFISR